MIHSPRRTGVPAAAAGSGDLLDVPVYGAPLHADLLARQWTHDCRGTAGLLPARGGELIREQTAAQNKSDGYGPKGLPSHGDTLLDRSSGARAGALPLGANLIDHR